MKKTAKASKTFKLGNGRYCFPLTVTDHASRYLLLCEALGTAPGTRQGLVFNGFRSRVDRSQNLVEIGS